jgi:hypothetical protein
MRTQPSPLSRCGRAVSLPLASVRFDPPLMTGSGIALRPLRVVTGLSIGRPAHFDPRSALLVGDANGWGEGSGQIVEGQFVWAPSAQMYIGSSPEYSVRQDAEQYGTP